MKYKLPKTRIYPITDARASGLSHAEQVSRLIADGATIILLRDDDASPKAFYEDAAAAVAVTREFGVKLIIHRRIDIAMAIGADGVHLEQDDMALKNARAVLGDDAIIGISSHCLEEATVAVFDPVDYIAVGPMFEGSARESYLAVDPTVFGKVKFRIHNVAPDFKELAASKDVYAFGRITPENVTSIIEAEADGVLVPFDLYSSTTERVRLFLVQDDYRVGSNGGGPG